MKKKVRIHIGYAKTGSSAVQAWLHENRWLLAESGRIYPQRSIDGQQLISSGNGQVLIDYLGGRRTFEEVDRLYKFSDPSTVTLISSERIRLTLEAIDKLHALVQEFQLDIEFLAYVREPYAWLHSRYLQRVKRHNFTGDFLSFLKRTKRISFITECFNLKHSGFKFKLVSYDQQQDNVLAPFCEFIGVDCDDFVQVERINRSLTQEEASLVATFERYLEDSEHAGKGRQLADQLVANHVPIGRKVTAKYSQQEAKFATRRYREQINDFNQEIGQEIGILLSTSPEIAQKQMDNEAVLTVLNDKRFKHAFDQAFHDEVAVFNAWHDFVTFAKETYRVVP